MSLPVISSFWTGGPLGTLQKICLTSFALRGHRVELYTDQDGKNVPACIHCIPAHDIWNPPTQFWNRAPPTLLSDVFRLLLLQQKDTIWVDTDAYCSRPFDFPDPNLFGWLKGQLATGVLRLPQDSQTLIDMLDFALGGNGLPIWLNRGYQARAAAFENHPPLERLLHFYNVRPGFIGPKALHYFTRKNRIRRRAQPEHRFYPVRPADSQSLFEPGSAHIDQNPETYSVHFYGRAIALAQHKQGSRAALPVPQPGSFAHKAMQETRHLWA
jgi:hypothetical protein